MLTSGKADYNIKMSVTNFVGESDLTSFDIRTAARSSTGPTWIDDLYFIILIYNYTTMGELLV